MIIMSNKAFGFKMLRAVVVVASKSVLPSVVFSFLAAGIMLATEDTNPVDFGCLLPHSHLIASVITKRETVSNIDFRKRQEFVMSFKACLKTAFYQINSLAPAQHFSQTLSPFFLFWSGVAITNFQ